MSNAAAVTYPRWVQSYSNEDFDRIQALATRLTEEDRAAGRPTAAAGYSDARYEQAEGAVQAAKGW